MFFFGAVGDTRTPNGKLNVDKKINFIERSEIFNLIVAPERCKEQNDILNMYITSYFNLYLCLVDSILR